MLLIDLSALTSLLIFRLCTSAATFSFSDTTPHIVAAGVLVALVTLLMNQRRIASEEFLKNASDLLSNAYEILEKSKDDNGIPKNSRINWLTAARLIRTAESIAELLTEESHQRIWRETKEYWRGRLRDLINPSNGSFPNNYFAAKPLDMLVWGDGDQEPLSEKSLTVLYRFIQWPDHFEDPLKKERAFSDEEIEKMSMFGPKQLGELLKEARQITISKNI